MKQSDSLYRDALISPPPQREVYTPPPKRKVKKGAREKFLDDLEKFKEGVEDNDDEGPIPRKPRKQKGKGNKILKLKPNGEFGSAVIIDVPELVGGKLYAYNKINGKKILSAKADKTLQNLLFKKFDPKEKYTNKALDIYKRLIERVGSNNLGQKANIVLGKFSGVDPKFYSNPDDIMNRLEKIISSISSGNNSIQLKNEGSNIVDFLLSKKLMNKTQHKKMYEKYFK